MCLAPRNCDPNIIRTALIGGKGNLGDFSFQLETGEYNRGMGSAHSGIDEAAIEATSSITAEGGCATLCEGGCATWGVGAGVRWRKLLGCEAMKGMVL